MANTLWAYATMERQPGAGVMREMEGQAEAQARSNEQGELAYGCPQKDLDPPRKDLGGIARTSACLIDPQLGRHGRADARAPADGARVRSL